MKFSDSQSGKGYVMFFAKRYFLAWICLLISGVIFAAPGDFDTSFGGDGKVNFSFGSGSGAVLAVVQEADGKLKTAGYAYNNNTGEWDFALARFNADGTLDTGFGTAGKVTTAVGIDSEFLKVIQQQDGKWVAVGSNAGHVFLARFNADGSLDNSFDSDGKLATVVSNRDYGFSIVQQTDGKLVMAGTGCVVLAENGDCSQWSFILARYNDDGSLDAGFDGDGWLTTDVGPYLEVAYSVIQQQDGKLLVAGKDYSGLVLVRYNPDGSLDTTFSGDGRLQVAGSDLGSPVLVQQADGKLAVAVHSAVNTVLLMRFTLNGAFDTAFSEDGVLTVVFAASYYSGPGVSYVCETGSICFWPEVDNLALIQQADSQLVLADTGDGLFTLKRFHADGSQDASFVTNRPPPPPPPCEPGPLLICPIESEPGVISFNFESVFALMQQSDGKLVAAGQNLHDALIAKYESGQTDTDADGVYDELDDNDDGDGWLDTADNCPQVANTDQQNTDGDAWGDVCDEDDDNDGVKDAQDAFPLDASETTDTDHDGMGNNTDADDDADGVLDTADAFPTNSGEWQDTDQDGTGDNADLDDDGDYTFDAYDKFPLNRAASSDTDNDGFPDSWSYACESICQISSGLSLDNCASVANPDQLNTDGDAYGNVCDSDDDNDGVSDVNDVFPLDATESYDRDEDGIGDNADPDKDGDGVPNGSDAFPWDSTEWLNTDGDPWGNNADSDDDNDGVSDASDAFPLDATEILDTDHDGIGNNADQDDDNDGAMDVADAMPLNPSEWLDTDHDGIGNNVDADDDNDGVTDASDKFPLNQAVSVDTDNDGFANSWNASCNAACQSTSGVMLDNCPTATNPDQLNTDGDTKGDVCDTDDDNDGVLDRSDQFPLDASESRDFDHDGVGDNADTDDDNDGVPDSLAGVQDNCLFLANPDQLDTDGDARGNACDFDDDNDGVWDSGDQFPLDSSESWDNDGDGVGDNADADDDNDGVPDAQDALPWDPSDSVDTDADGVGNSTDEDDDDDGIPDNADSAPLDANPVLPLNAGFRGASVTEQQARH